MSPVRKEEQKDNQDPITFVKPGIVLCVAFGVANYLISTGYCIACAISYGQYFSGVYIPFEWASREGGEPSLGDL